jgi:hypothetical protein
MIAEAKPECWVSVGVVNECRKLVERRAVQEANGVYRSRAGVPSASVDGQQRRVGTLQDHNKQKYGQERVREGRFDIEQDQHT